MNNMKNKIQLIGHLGMNPEILNLESGKKLARLSIATNDSYKNAKGEKVEDTQWHNLIAWGKTADIIEQYLKKGNEIVQKLTNRFAKWYYVIPGDSFSRIRLTRADLIKQAEKTQEQDSVAPKPKSKRGR